MRKFKQNKLWRDKAVGKLERMGSKIHWEELKGDRFVAELKLKLLEETEEVCKAYTKEAVLEELADVLEVMRSFCDLHQVTLQDIEEIRGKKWEERGGFQGRKFVTMAEHLPGSFGEQYCLADPVKYPEIPE